LDVDFCCFSPSGHFTLLIISFSLSFPIVDLFFGPSL
jgi:hypothetical protein